MKKFISAAMALILIAVLAFSFAGCNKNNGDANTDGTQNAEVTGAKKYIDVELDSEAFKENEKLMLAYLDNKDLHFKTLTEGFGMSEEVANKYYEAPEEFYVYTYSLNVFNSGNEKVAVYGLRCENNAKDGVYINTYNALGAVYNLDVGAECGATIAVICNDPDLSQDQTRQIVDSMGIEVICSKVPLEYDDGTESVEETKYIKAEIDN